MSEACELVFTSSDSENEPLGDLGELEEDEIDDDGVGADDVPDNTHDNIPVIPDQHDVAHEGNNENAATAAEDDMLDEMDTEEQADAENLYQPIVILV